MAGAVENFSKEPKMTTDKIEIKEDTITDSDNADRKPKPTSEVTKQGDGERQPLQAQQRPEAQPDVQAKASDDDVGLPIGNKGKSPGNGG